MLTYDELTPEQIEALPRDATVFALAMSPIEVQGPRLPVGTDVMVAEGLLELAAAALGGMAPSLTFVSLPSLYLGADSLPVPGCLGVSAKALESIIHGIGCNLAKQGFRYLLVMDNHAGPSHQRAVYKAVRSLWRKHKFHCIAPVVEMGNCSDSPLPLSVRMLREAMGGNPPRRHPRGWSLRPAHRLR